MNMRDVQLTYTQHFSFSKKFVKLSIMQCSALYNIAVQGKLLFRKSVPIPMW